MEQVQSSINPPQEKRGAPNPIPPRARSLDPKTYARAKVTNHVGLLPGNGNTMAARRFRDLVNKYLLDMGGVDICSEIRIGLARRLAAATVRSEQLEARMVDGEHIDVATLSQLASTIIRLSARLGLDRVPKLVVENEPTKAGDQWTVARGQKTAEWINGRIIDHDEQTNSEQTNEPR
jgi:hypothetical protein